jgi:hypothetical protein
MSNDDIIPSDGEGEAVEASPSLADTDLNLVDDWFPETSNWADQEEWDGE